MALSASTSILSAVSRTPCPGWNRTENWCSKMLETAPFVVRHARSMQTPAIDTHQLTLSCDNRPGIVAAVSTALFESGADITEAQQFDDMASGRFFMRVAFHLTESTRRIDALLDRFLSVATRFGMRWKMHRRAIKQRVLILASRQSHCLMDLLYQTRIGTLPMDVVAIVSNHPRDALDAVVPEDIPYHHLPTGFSLPNSVWRSLSGASTSITRFCLDS